MENNNNISHRNPYMGIYSYEERDRDYFWGREIETKEISKSILLSNSTIITGYSGCGKTSLINAGITPTLRVRNCYTLKIRPKAFYVERERERYADFFWEQIHVEIIKKVEEFKKKKSISKKIKLKYMSEEITMKQWKKSCQSTNTLSCERKRTIQTTQRSL